MPGIGLRTIKSAVAVFLCFLIYLIRQNGIPFYSAIAAILCMQPYVQNSKKVAMNRTVATFIGGFAGMLVLLLQRHVSLFQLPLLQYGLIALCIVPLIHLTVVLQKPSASYITCVVFLSVTVSHGGDVSPYLFAFNRILDTLIGIFVSLGVNMFRLPLPQNRDILFVSDLDGTLLDPQGKLSSYTKVRLNRLVEEGMLFSIATARTPATVVPLLQEINIRLPVIVMNGAALYDMGSKTYIDYHLIPYPAARRVLDIFSEQGCNCFTAAVVQDILHIYYQKLQNPAEQRFFNARRHLPLKSYLYAQPPEDQDIVYITCIDTLPVIQAVREKILALDCAKELNTVYYPTEERDGYYYFEISSIRASKAEALRDLKQRTGAKVTAAFGDNHNDLPMLQAADHSFAVSNAVAQVKEAAESVIGSNAENAVAKALSRLFHSRHPFADRR